MERLIKNQLEFINRRFGMFIHFNSATVQFCQKEISDWEYDVENSGTVRQYPFSEQDWNPDQLDCTQWAKAAKTLGAEFAILTAKHHEGFALWPTKYSKHSVKNAACKTDVVAAYLEAFRKEGIAAGLYFSILDLTEGIGKKRCNKSDRALIENQIRELLTEYGPIPYLVTDGWDAPWGGPRDEELPFHELDQLVKSLQPDCLFMNIGCQEGLEKTDIMFFENAAGQETDTGFMGPGAACNILTDQWFNRLEDRKKPLKSAEWVLEKIKQYNAQNTFFILNASPNRHGVIEDNLLQRFEEIGRQYRKMPPLQSIPNGWQKRNG